MTRHLLVTNDFPPKVGGIQNYLWELWRQQAEKERGEQVPLSEVAKPIEAETLHHVLITDLPDELRLLVEDYIGEGRRALEGNEQARSALPSRCISSTISMLSSLLPPRAISTAWRSTLTPLK